MTTGQKAPHAWQTEAFRQVLERWERNARYKALIAACPGAGKTRIAVQLGDHLLRSTAIELALVLVPTINIRRQWITEFDFFGINAVAQVSNAALRWRRDADPQKTMREDKAAIAVTYAQLARDAELFEELTRRHRTLLIADEVHHADEDETFGEAIGAMTGNIVHSLALSGTPFNTVGGSLALCESTDVLDPDTSKMMRRTDATFTYSYANAINNQVCRRAEFVKVDGSGRATYRSLIDNRVWERLLNTGRKSDPIGMLLNPNGEYMSASIREALKALTLMRAAGDRRAAMLVVARNISHGNLMVQAIERIKLENPEWAQFANIQAVYNDTDKAHDRIKALEDDNTDIIVSVRMISEGVDIKRLRVGLYATDWMTRMFFIQFIGRFVRYEARLDTLQYAVVVLPAHPDLLKWTREIEQMILVSEIRITEGEGGGASERKNQLIGVETAAEGTGLIFRGVENERDEEVVTRTRQMSSVFMRLTESEVLQVAHDLGASGISGPPPASPFFHSTAIDWRKRNQAVVAQIVRFKRSNGVDQSDEDLFREVNGTANNRVGVPRIDELTPEDVLERRWQFLRDWLRQILSEINPGLRPEDAGV